MAKKNNIQKYENILFISEPEVNKLSLRENTKEITEEQYWEYLKIKPEIIISINYIKEAFFNQEYCNKNKTKNHFGAV